MWVEISKKCSRVAPSATLQIDAKAKKMKAEGLDVVGFGAGEPDFDTPSFIIDAAKEALDQGMTRYTPASGTVKLKKAIVEKFRKDNGLIYDPAQVIVSNGAKHSIYNTLQAILNIGDEVIIPSPFWVSYPEMVRMADGVPVSVITHEEDNFVPRPSAIEAAVTEKTKAIIINSPNNPCGCVYDKNTLEAIAYLAKKHNFYIISDEIYEALLYNGQKHISIASLSEDAYRRTIVINGVSKSYAMTGWRIGYAAGPKDVITAMSNYQSHATSNPNSIAQYAAAAAIEGPKDATKAMVQAFHERRDYMIATIASIPGLSAKMPGGAFYVMLNIKDILGKRWQNKRIDGSMAFTEALLEAENVAVVPGDAFEAEGYVRLSYATSMQNIEKGLARIAHFVSELQN
jgi:aspartate aminotransferase